MDHLRSKKRPTTRTVDIVLDDEAAERYNEAKQALDRARIIRDARPQDPAVHDEYTDAEAAFEEVRREIDEEGLVVTFRFRNIGRTAYDDLVALHKPTKEQRDEAKKDGTGRPNFNIDTFPVALIAASSDEPKLTEAEVKELTEDPRWNIAEFMSLFNAAQEANTTRRVIDLGKG